jgi:hypothetical protein
MTAADPSPQVAQNGPYHRRYAADLRIHSEFAFCAGSTGIATVDKPFTLGGTQFAEVFDQGWYGWIGDVRIAPRPLHPTEFLARPTNA